MTDLARATAGLTPDQVELLLRRLAKKRPADPAAHAEEILPRPRDGSDPPLSLAQEQLWLLDRLDPGNPAFNILYPVRLRGALDAEALARALDEVVRRHEALRTTFPEVDGRAVQRVHAESLTPLVVEDLSGLPPARRDAELLARSNAAGGTRFDLLHGPLFTASLLRLGDEDQALLLTVHHIVGDGWSLDVLFRELTTLYEAFRHGLPSPLPEPRLQFADWAAWQRTRFDGERGKELVAWWRQALDGVPPALPFPTDRPRTPSAVHAGGGHGFPFPAELAEKLNALGREEGATLFMTLLAVFDILLFRWTGAEDFVVGTPVANRTRVEAEALIGYMINTLVIRTRLEGDPTVRALLGRVREAVAGAYAHQELPFETMVDLVQPELRPTYHPVFQASLVLQNATRDLRLPGVSDELLPAERTSTEFDFTMHIAEQRDGSLWCGFEYSTELYDADTIVRLGAHFRRLAEAVVAAPDTRISALPLLTEDERRRLAAWNDTAAAYPRGVCTHHLFEAQARTTPDAVALRFPGGTVTYAQLDRRATVLARRLRARGVGPEVAVGVCLDRSPALVVALLAVWKAGGAFVPLDPSHPPRRLREILDAAGARLVLTDPARVEALAGGLAEPLCLRPDGGMDDGTGDDGGTGDGDALAGGVEPRNLAYVVYTSGPTRAPLGVAVQHDGLVNAAAALRERLDVGPGDRWLQFSSAASDAAVLELVAALGAGAALVLPPREALLPGPDLARLLADEGVTHALLPPSALAAMSAAELPALRVLCSAGEACPPEVAEQWAPERTLVNLYGATETTLAAASARLAAGGGKPMIGTPLPNLRAYVTDAGLRLLPLGVGGELCVGGVGVARGYLGRPALTAERFVPDAFSGEPGARLYRTGDMARWRPEGVLELLGRTDAQVKLRGCRVEPLEVETVLRAHPGVAEGVVVARETADGDHRLVAYLVPAALAPEDAVKSGPYGYERVSVRVLKVGELVESVRAWLAERLPAYMVPAVILPVGGLPRTPAGKLDRRALPDPGARRAERPYTEPRDDVERTVAEVWAQALGVERVGAEDDFFALGGHSLLAVRAHAMLVDRLGPVLGAIDLFRYPTVATLAARLRQGESG